MERDYFVTGTCKSKMGGTASSAKTPTHTPTTMNQVQAIASVLKLPSDPRVCGIPTLVDDFASSKVLDTFEPWYPTDPSASYREAVVQIWEEKLHVETSDKCVIVQETRAPGYIHAKGLVFNIKPECTLGVGGTDIKVSSSIFTRRTPFLGLFVFYTALTTKVPITCSVGYLSPREEKKLYDESSNMHCSGLCYHHGCVTLTEYCNLVN